MIRRKSRVSFGFLADIIAAYILDMIFGDPHWMPHPVRFIGWMIKRSEDVLRGIIDKGINVKDDKKASRERFAGAVLTLLVVSAVFLLVYVILAIAQGIHPLLFHLLNIYLIYTALAAKCLGVETMKVYNALVLGDVSKARERLSMLVGRQTDNLDEEGIIRGAVETVAENTVDGVISPLFYIFLGSFFGIAAPLAYAFKAVSTLDSMVGYMNEKYVNFGRFSAKTDDAANFIPARLSGLLIPASAFLCGKSFKKSFSIMLRDRRNHKSPNSAYPEAAVAGALGVRLGGANVYFGQVVEKPTIGDALKRLEPKDIADTIKIMHVSAFLTLVFGIMLWFLFLL